MKKKKGTFVLKKRLLFFFKLLNSWLHNISKCYYYIWFFTSALISIFPLNICIKNNNKTYLNYGIWLTILTHTNLTYLISTSGKLFVI